MRKKLFVIVGATGIGKTAMSIRIAKALGTEILSADSRQIYRHIPIGTAAPTAEEMAEARHHFVDMLELDEYYSCGRYEEDALRVLQEVFEKKDAAVMCGGSMLYVDAVCKGIDDLPDVDRDLRDGLWERYAKEGIDGIWGELRILDPEYCKTADPKNYKRVIHALELTIESGKPYSSLLKRQTKERDFDIIKIGLALPREEMYERINMRTEAMMRQGLLEEAKSVYHLRELNSLNTVGYKEMFAYLDGKMTIEEAKEEIKKNTRRYAKKQVTWWKRDEELRWFSPYDAEGVLKFVEEKMNEKE